MSEAVQGDLVVLPPVADDPVFSDELQPEALRRLGNDPHEFAALYMRHRWSFALHARRFLHDQRDIDEVVQEGFLKLFLALPELDSELQALAYARRTITNLCIDRYRADQRRPRLVDLESAPMDVLAEDEDIDPIVAAEDAALVREALAKLSPLHREALLKREVEEKPLPQIAAELDIPVEQVKHVLHRARAALRRLLVGTHVEPGVDLDLAAVMVANAARARAAAKPTGAAVVALLLVLAGVIGLRSGTRTPAQVAGDVPVGATGLLEGAPGHGFVPVTPAAPAPAASKPHATKVAKPVRTLAGGGSAPHVPSAPVAAPTTAQVAPPAVAPPVVPSVAASNKRLALSGLLAATSAPTLAAAETFVHDSGTQLAFSKFAADTDQGPVALAQTLTSDPSGGLVYEVDAELPVAGEAVPAQLTPATNSVQRNLDGTVSVLLTAQYDLGQTAPGGLPASDRLVVQAVYDTDLTTLLAERVVVGGPNDPLTPLDTTPVTDGNNQGGDKTADGATVRPATSPSSLSSGRENPSGRDQDPLPSSE